MRYVCLPSVIGTYFRAASLLQVVRMITPSLFMMLKAICPLAKVALAWVLISMVKSSVQSRCPDITPLLLKTLADSRNICALAGTGFCRCQCCLLYTSDAADDLLCVDL